MTLRNFSEYLSESRKGGAFALHESREWEAEHANWLIAPVGQSRDADVLTRTNWAVQLEAFEYPGQPGPGEEGAAFEVLHFGHWAVGWYELVIVRPGTFAAEKAQELADRLDNYPVLDEERFSGAEQEEANEVWRNCYTWRQRAAYIRQHAEQFDLAYEGPQGWRMLLATVRGKFFTGYASELMIY